MINISLLSIMEKLNSRLTLLALFSIFFIYKTFDAAVLNNPNEATFWFLFTVMYLISLLVAFIVMKKLKKEQKV